MFTYNDASIPVRYRCTVQFAYERTWNLIGKYLYSAGRNVVDDKHVLTLAVYLFNY